MIAAVLLALAAALSLLMAALPGDRLSGRVPVGLLTLLLAGSALATALGSQLTGRAHAGVVVVGLLVAAVAGSQLTSVVFEAIDDSDRQHPDRHHADTHDPRGSDLRSAGQVLRGGTWIGVLERLAVFATLVARWPEGIAIVLAVKGLGRYPELRAGTNPSLAERFIIGTLVSVLWAALCAYAASGPALG